GRGPRAALRAADDLARVGAQLAQLRRALAFSGDALLEVAVEVPEARRREVGAIAVRREELRALAGVFGDREDRRPVLPRRDAEEHERSEHEHAEAQAPPPGFIHRCLARRA